MYVIVVGGGKIGQNLSRVLLTDGHEVLVLEKDIRRCERIAEELGSIVMRGDGCEVATLEAAGIARADMLIAVTGDDEDNLVACQVAKYKFGVTRTIALANKPSNEALFRKLGVDKAVNNVELILAQIRRDLPSHLVSPLISLKNLEMEIVDVRIPPHSAAAGKSLKDIPLPENSIVSLVINKESGAQIPNEETIVEAEDELVAVIKKGDEEALREAFS
ncbi:MAG: TrkA family potassium uptake protein [Chloroflexi bacterium]|nr:TrkA family potassium uptake protein [Chloroflexota bacterium]